MKKLFILFSAIIIVAVLWLAPWQAKKETVTASPSIELGLKGEAQALVRTGSTFPAEEAGIATYLRITPLDMVKAAMAFNSIYKQGGNWIIGTIGIRVYPEWDVNYINNIARVYEVKTYIDSQGWIVAYQTRAEEVARIMMWTGIDIQNPKLEAINTNTLEEALKKTVLAIGTDFSSLKSNISYYHFGYPEANRITLVAKLIQSPVMDGTINLSVTQGSVVYDTSSSAIANGLSSYFYQEGSAYTIINHPIHKWDPVGAGIGHRFGVYYTGGPFVAGIAVVLVYKAL